MTDVQIKDAVRERDGHKCRDCGMTNDEHRKKYGKSLPVHRIVPGLAYREYICVTLCHACHTKKPCRTAQAFYGCQHARTYAESNPNDLLGFASRNGVVTMYFNYYDAGDHRILERLNQLAEWDSVSPWDLLEKAVVAGIDRLEEEQAAGRILTLPRKLDFDLSEVA